MSKQRKNNQTHYTQTRITAGSLTKQQIRQLSVNVYVHMSDLIIKLDICSVSSILPSGQLSNVPWRRSGVKYANNEAYFDVVEEVDAIVDKSGATVSAEIQGYVS